MRNRLENLQKIPEYNLHWYGKEVEQSGRKLGHLTIKNN